MKGQTKLNKIQVNHIRQLYLTGLYSQSEIGLMFNVGSNNIGRIVRNETWIN